MVLQTIALTTLPTGQFQLIIWLNWESHVLSYIAVLPPERFSAHSMNEHVDVKNCTSGGSRTRHSRFKRPIDYHYHTEACYCGSTRIRTLVYQLALRLKVGCSDLTELYSLVSSVGFEPTNRNGANLPVAIGSASCLYILSLDNLTLPTCRDVFYQPNQNLAFSSSVLF